MPAVSLAPFAGSLSPLETGLEDVAVERRVLLVVEAGKSFLRKYVAGMAGALRGRGVAASSLDLSGETYEEALRVAEEQGISHVHFCFMLDPQGLYRALSRAGHPDITVSYSVFGLARHLG